MISPTAANQSTFDHFADAMRGRYQTQNLVGITPQEFRSRLDAMLSVCDGEMEGYKNIERQRDLSVRFHWGHDHDFGDFQLNGRMGNRHLSIPSYFVDCLRVLPRDLAGKRVLDVGVWTGGTSLLLCALGAEVVAIEEVRKYADAVRFLKDSFGIDNLEVQHRSLFSLTAPDFFDRFDYVFYSGVIYHVTDPVLSLRILYNTLKDGGVILIETMGIDAPEPILRYEGPAITKHGSREELNRAGWNWFLPSPSALRQMIGDVGFRQVQVSPVINERIFGTGTRTAHEDINRAGLSVATIR